MNTGQTTRASFSRRAFAKGAAAAFTVPFILRDSCFGKNAGDKPNLAFVGLGGQGKGNPKAQALVDVPAREGWRGEDLTKAGAGEFVKGSRHREPTISS